MLCCFMSRTAFLVNEIRKVMGRIRECKWYFYFHAHLHFLKYSIELLLINSLGQKSGGGAFGGQSGGTPSFGGGALGGERSNSLNMQRHTSLVCSDFCLS